MPQIQRTLTDVAEADLTFKKSLLALEGFTVEVRNQANGLFTLIATKDGQPDPAPVPDTGSVDPPSSGKDTVPLVASVAIDAGLSRVAAACLAAIADGESSAWNELFGGGTFDSYDQFPDWPGIVTAAGPTHAAGRFQFQPGTWAPIARRLGLSDYGKRSQVLGAWEDARTVYRRKTGNELEDALIAGDLDRVATQLHSEWTSITRDRFPDRFRAHLDAI